jgi:hypothetical protein
MAGLQVHKAQKISLYKTIPVRAHNFLVSLFTRNTVHALLGLAGWYPRYSNVFPYWANLELLGTSERKSAAFVSPEFKSLKSLSSMGVF